MKQEKQFVAMTHKLCPFCADKVEEGILIHRRFGDLSEIHNKATGFGNLCPECQKGLDMGGIAIIVVDQSKSGTEFKDLYRCGVVHFMKEEAIRRMLEGSTVLDEVLKRRFLVMDYQMAKDMGLEVNYPR